MRLLIALLLVASSDYSAALSKIASTRAGLARKLAAARTDGERAAVLEAARAALLASVDADIFPAWFGTPWDFNGTTQTPGEGKIACGYFVTTVMRDLGF